MVVRADYKVKEFMTALPHTIGADISLDVAAKLMRTEGFRHLPVQKAGKLVGLLSSREINLVENIDKIDSIKEFVVADVMTEEPYTCDKDTALKKVVNEMFEHKYGSAIVLDNEKKVLGIFTVSDALRALSTFLG